MSENLLGRMHSYARNGAKATIQAVGNHGFTAMVEKISVMPYDVQVNYIIDTSGGVGRVYEVTFTLNSNCHIQVGIQHEKNGAYPRDAGEFDISKKGTYRFCFEVFSNHDAHQLIINIGCECGKYDISDISVTRKIFSEPIEITENKPIVETVTPETEDIQEASEKIQELESAITFYDKKLSALVGKSVRIVPECEEYFTRNHELKPLDENDILRSRIFTVKDYQFGMYVLSFPKKCDILVSFEMVTRV